MKLSECQRKKCIPEISNPAYGECLNLSNNLLFTLNNKDIKIEMESLQFIKNLGEGHFSAVQLMEDPVTKLQFAVKKCNIVANDVLKDIFNDITIGKSFSSTFKIDYYGGLKNNFYVWILMEPMDLSVKKFYEQIHDNDSQFRFPGQLLGYFSYCCVIVLEEFHLRKLIHRDVKPSNMLVNASGKFKLCDFGISGKLKDSYAQSAVGTNAYLAPERIAPKTHGNKFDIKSDVWSLGLSILEVAEMEFAFKHCDSLMKQLTAIVLDPPPRLSADSPYHVKYPQLAEFVEHTLVKEPKKRYTYNQLKPLKLISDFLDPDYFNEAQTILSTLVQQYNF